MLQYLTLNLFFFFRPLRSLGRAQWPEKKQDYSLGNFKKHHHRLRRVFRRRHRVSVPIFIFVEEMVTM